MESEGVSRPTSEVVLDSKKKSKLGNAINWGRQGSKKNNSGRGEARGRQIRGGCGGVWGERWRGRVPFGAARAARGIPGRSRPDGAPACRTHALLIRIGGAQPPRRAASGSRQARKGRGGSAAGLRSVLRIWRLTEAQAAAGRRARGGETPMQG
eukprot:scaffold17205_cov125-Isochrysis_galbana.AAC.2